MMNLDKLFALQQQLDDRIRNEHGLEDSDLFMDKVLALYVEIGELANETRCFKYWSNKPPADKETILEEYVDGLHFILSLGLELELNKDIPHFATVNHEATTLTGLFLQVVYAINELKQNRSKEAYWYLMTVFFELGEALGFAESDIEQAYLAKNEVNHQRQDEGY